MYSANSVLVGQSNVVCIAVFPPKKQAVFLVHTDAVLSLSLVLILLKVVARNRGQITQAGRGVQHREFSLGHARRRILRFAGLKSLFRPVVRERLDHDPNSNVVRY